MTEEYTKIEDLIDANMYSEAIDLVEKLPRDKSPEQIRYLILRSCILNGQGDYPEALKLAEQALKESQDSNDNLEAVNSLIAMLDPLWRLGRYHDGLARVSEAEKMLLSIKQQHLQRLQGWLTYHRGRFSQFMAEFDITLPLYQRIFLYI